MALPPIQQSVITNDGNTTVEGRPRFSPDGQRIAYTTAASANSNPRDIVVMEINTLQISATIATETDDTNPVFSPDSRFIAYSSNIGAGIYNIYIYDRIGETTYQLTEHQNRPVFVSGWAN